MKYFSDNCDAIYENITGCQFFAGKTAFWKNCFKNK